MEIKFYQSLLLGLQVEQKTQFNTCRNNEGFGFLTKAPKDILQSQISKHGSSQLKLHHYHSEIPYAESEKAETSVPLSLHFYSEKKIYAVLTTYDKCENVSLFKFTKEKSVYSIENET